MTTYCKKLYSLSPVKFYFFIIEAFYSFKFEISLLILSLIDTFLLIFHQYYLNEVIYPSKKNDHILYSL